MIAHAKRDALLEAAEDTIQTWLVFRPMDQDAGFHDSAKAAQATVELFRDLLALGLLEAGVYGEGEWSWGLSATEAMRQVEAECGRLAAGVNDFSGCWFRATAAGSAWVQRYYNGLALLSPEKVRPDGP